MRKIAFLILLFLHLSAPSALATEYGALAVGAGRSPLPLKSPWPIGTALHQRDIAQARASAYEQCMRLNDGLWCRSIVFESGECAAFTAGTRQGVASQFLSVGPTERQAVAENERNCLAQGNDTCSLRMTLCQPYSSFMDQAHFAVNNFLDGIGVSTHVIYLPYAGAVALLLFVFFQMRTFIQVRHHAPRDIVRNAVYGATGGFIITGSCLVLWFGVPKFIAFVMGLSPANKVMLAAITIGIVAFALPIRFWDALKRTLASPRKSPMAQFTAPDALTESQSALSNPPTSSAVGGPPRAADPPSYDLPPGQPIALKLKRTQKPSFSGVIYMLDARIDVSAEIRALIAKHNLGSHVIYESSDRQKHAENVQAHLADSHSQASLFAPASQQAMGAAKTFWKLGRAALSAARAALALRITVNSLLSGVHVECKSMDELLEAEDAIREAKTNLEGYIAAAQTFDGREEIV